MKLFFKISIYIYRLDNINHTNDSINSGNHGIQVKC